MSVRWRWLGAVVGMVSAAWIALVVVATLVSAGEFDSPISPYSVAVTYPGWQLDVAAIACGLVAIVSTARFVVMAIRLRRAVPLKAPSRGLLVLVGFVVGALVTGPIAGLVVAVGLHRASTHTAAAREADAEDREWLVRIVGDATHRPEPPHFGVAAPPALAAPLLAPRDLGQDWRYFSNPGDIVGGVAAPSDASLVVPPIPSGFPTPVSRVLTTLAVQHWTGRYWLLGQDVHEGIDRFATNADAERWVHASIKFDEHETCPAQRGCADSPPSFDRPQVVDRNKVVWLAHGTRAVLFALIVDGKVGVDLGSFSYSDAAPGLTGTAILRAALQRLDRAKA